MASTDISAQGTKFRISSGDGTAITITGITKASPAVVTASNTLSAGDIVRISGVVGMTEVNGRAFVVASPSGSNFQLKGVDSTGYTTYSSAGSAYKQTMVDVGNAKNFDGFDGSAPEVDVTCLDSIAKEYVMGLQDFGNASVDIGLDPTNSGQVQLSAAKATGNPTAFSLTLKNGQAAAFMAYVKQFTVALSPDSSVRGKVGLRITGAPAWFA